MRPLSEIAQHREELSARSANERAAIASGFHQLRAPLSAADRVFGLVQFMRAHPVVVGAAAAVVVALARGRIRLLPLFGRVIAGWRIWQMVGGLLAARQSQRETVSR